jgi:hypothetical protein
LRSDRRSKLEQRMQWPCTHAYATVGDHSGTTAINARWASVCALPVPLQILPKGRLGLPCDLITKLLTPGFLTRDSRDARDRPANIGPRASRVGFGESGHSGQPNHASLANKDAGSTAKKAPRKTLVHFIGGRPWLQASRHERSLATDNSIYYITLQQFSAQL